MQIKREIFKEYDIRGIYPSEISKESAYIIGRHLSSMINNKKRLRVVVGQDLRKNSKPLLKSLLEGLSDSGVDVLDIGIVTTPMLYFAVPALDTTLGIMITASHNPQKYDGFKIIRSTGLPVGGEELQSFYKVVAKPLPPASKQKGRYNKIDVSKKYFDTIFKDFSITRPINISIDDGSGTAKFFIEELKNRLSGGVKLKPKQRPDLYATFDYDADRLIVNDENKKEMRGDVMGAIVADNMLRKKDTLIYDPRCSWGVRKYFLNKGIKTTVSRVGHYNIKRAMEQYNGIVGIEITGHIYFKNLTYSESPFFALRKIVEQLDKNPDKKVSELFVPFGEWYHSGTIDIKIKDLEKTLEKLKEFYRTGSQDYLDGLTVEFPNRWWFNIRPSHTEPVIRMVVEANTEELLKEKIKEIKSLIS